MTRIAALAAALAVAVAAPQVARADEPDVLVYKAKTGDTLELVAAELYGDHGQVILLVVANKLVKPRPLRPGEKLRVPRNRQYVTQPGDKLPALAKELLGDEQRAWLLAQTSGMADEAAPLAAGTLIEVPIHLSHTPAGPEPLTTIAQQYYGDAKEVELLRKYNALDHDTIDKGETIEIPLPNVKLRKPPPLDAESQARRDKADASERAVQIALPQAQRAWRDGEFALVRDLLSPIDLAYVDAKAAVDAAVQLGEAELAFDDADSQKQATEAFKAAIDRGAPPLRAFSVSPKVRAAWTAAGGTVDEK